MVPWKKAGLVKNSGDAMLIPLDYIYIIHLFFWSPSITDDHMSVLKRARDHVLRKSNVGSRYIVPSPQTWPSNKTSNGTKNQTKTALLGGCDVLPQYQFVVTLLCVNTTQALSLGAHFLWELPERYQTDIKLMIFP